MKNIKEGKWMPIDLTAPNHLPRTRKWTWMEALVCLQADLHKGSLMSISSYATQWKWTRRRVSDFIDALLSEEGWVPPKKGRKEISTNKVAQTAQGIRLYNNDLEKNTAQLPHSKSTTSIKSINKNTLFLSDAAFEEWWKTFFLPTYRKGRARSKKDAKRVMQKFVKSDSDIRDIELAVKHYLKLTANKDSDLVQLASTFFNQIEDHIAIAKDDEGDEGGYKYQPSEYYKTFN